MTDRLGRWYVDAPDGTYRAVLRGPPTWSAARPGEPTWASESYPGRLVSSAPTPVTVAGGVGASDLDIRLVRVVTNTAAPVVTGIAASGNVLTATPGTWTAPDRGHLATTWLRDGVAVGNLNSHHHRQPGRRRAGPAGPGDSCNLRGGGVTGVVGDLQGEPARDDDGRPGLLASAAQGPHQDHGERPRPHADGSFTILRGSKVLKAGVALVEGRAKIVLRGQRSGWRRYSVVYEGAAQTLPEQMSPTFRVRGRC